MEQLEPQAVADRREAIVVGGQAPLRDGERRLVVLVIIAAFI